MADDDYNYCDRQRERRNVSTFRSLIATPASGAFTMPAGARISFVATAGAVAGSTLALLVGATSRTIKAKTLAVGDRQVLDYAERGVVITPTVGIAVYVDKGLSKWAKIAQG